ncbi:MAG: hypothetical protein M0Q13_12225 [Methanothrix sp.]|jgi:hypothetical protein|nr:hypothetical protein [Methanothrix sp.]
MTNRSYYSIRTGKNPYSSKIELPILLRLFHDLFLTFWNKDYFQETFGYYCVDAGDVQGTLGSDIEAQMFLIFRKSNLWPIESKCLNYSEDDLFDIIEFIYDSISKPIDGWYHDYSSCGWHYTKFDRNTGREEFRSQVNILLRDYLDGFELSENGEILASIEDGLDDLVKEQLVEYDPKNIDSRIESAKLKFRRYRSSQEEKRDAIRDLADVMEFLRPQIEKVLSSKDENDLFSIANSFGIRHHNDKQKTDYDRSIWYNWMFYYYLATIHTIIKLIKNK